MAREVRRYEALDGTLHETAWAADQHDEDEVGAADLLTFMEANRYSSHSNIVARLGDLTVRAARFILRRAEAGADERDARAQAGQGRCEHDMGSGAHGIGDDDECIGMLDHGDGDFSLAVEATEAGPVERIHLADVLQSLDADDGSDHPDPVRVMFRLTDSPDERPPLDADDK
jgi:hypothetical protein